MIAFFDVDNTLVDGYVGYFTTILLLKKGMLKRSRIPKAIYYSIFGPLLEGTSASANNLRRMYEIAAEDMAGIALEDVLAVGRECFEKDIRPRLFQTAVDLVREHTRKGDPVYLLTSGPYMTVRILAEFLGADGSYSAGPVIDEAGRLTNQVKLPICYREGKVTAAEEIIQKHGASWNDCTYYADSMDDMFLFEKVAHPVVINPQKTLERIGRERGWPVLTLKRRL
jgi:HAD superfamily hydrolase (TIGR01490 family)